MARREIPKPIEIPKMPNSDADWLKLATSFEIRLRFDENNYNDAVYHIERRSKDTWAVISSGRFALSKSTYDFIYESMPSHRTEEFIADTRFPDLPTAWRHFLGYLDHHEVGPGGMSRKK